MGQLNFITTNPYTTAYNAANAAGEAERNNDLNYQAGKQKLAKDIAMTPFEVREAQARASSSESASRVANATEGSKISEAGSQASTAESTSRVANATENSKIAEAGSQAESAATGAKKSALDLDTSQKTQGDVITESGNKAAESGSTAKTAAATADVATQTTKTKVQQAQASLEQTRAQTREANALASNTSTLRSYELGVKAMDALAKGNVDVAEEYARQAGHPIPPMLLQDSRLAEAVDRINKDAARKYPNRPADQEKYAVAATQAMMNKLGELNYNPAASIAPPGAPTPPEQTYSPLRTTSINGFNSAGMNLNDKRLIDVATAANRTPAKFPATGYTVDNAGIARALMRGNPPRPDLARIYDPSIGTAETASPLSGSMPMPGRSPPPAAIEYLKQNPDKAPAFDQKYGAGASKAALGQ